MVKVEGSRYCRPGAWLLLNRDGEWVGGISGGYLEGDRDVLGGGEGVV